ncbi:hypothetical protein AN958_06040, partial [Leucoagaricus sp. SymC.cos]
WRYNTDFDKFIANLAQRLCPWDVFSSGEKIELSKLLERVPRPIKESVEEPAAKINVLLQAYISQLKLDGFVPVADMVFVQQSAGRILRAVFDICLKHGWTIPAKAALNLCKMVEKRMWGSMTPLRQFKGVPAEIIRKAEGKQFPWYRYFDLTPPEIGELIGIQNAGKLVHRLVHSFPKLQVQAHVQSITRSLLRVNLSIISDFLWTRKSTVERKRSLSSLKTSTAKLFSSTTISFCANATPKTNTKSLSPYPCLNLSLPTTSSPSSQTIGHTPKHIFPTLPLDLQPLPVSALHNKGFEQIYVKSIPTFNKIQTQTFQALYMPDENVFIGAPTGSGGGGYESGGVEEEVWEGAGWKGDFGFDGGDECGFEVVGED